MLYLNNFKIAALYISLAIFLPFGINLVTLLIVTPLLASITNNLLSSVSIISILANTIPTFLVTVKANLDISLFSFESISVEAMLPCDKLNHKYIFHL